MEVKPRPCCDGFTLLEVVLVMGLSTLIVGGMALALQSQEKAYRDQGSSGEELQSVNLALKRLQQDLQLAGTGLPPRTLPAIVPGSGDGMPVLTIRYLTDIPFVTKLDAPATDQSRIFHIPPKDMGHFRKGDQVLVHNDGAWLSFRAEAVQSRSSPPGLLPGPEVLSSAGDGPFRLTFPQGSDIFRLRDAEIWYHLAGGEAWDGRLIRRQGDREEIIAVNVHDLVIEYRVASPDHAYAPGPQWTLSPPEDAAILETRVRLVIGRTAIRFTVAPRNLRSESPS